MSRFSFLTLPSDESLVVVVPFYMVGHKVRENTLGISTLESKSRDYKLGSCNTAQFSIPRAHLYILSFVLHD
jgi:hypothetical protein